MPLKMPRDQFAQPNFAAIFHLENDLARNITIRDSGTDAVMQWRRGEARRALLFLIHSEIQRRRASSAPWRRQKFKLLPTCSAKISIRLGYGTA